jgi:hypothetical protein
MVFVQGGDGRAEDEGLRYQRTTGATSYKVKSIFDPGQAPAKSKRRQRWCAKWWWASRSGRIVCNRHTHTWQADGDWKFRSTCASGETARGLSLIVCAGQHIVQGRVTTSYEDVDDAIIPSLRHRLLHNRGGGGT